MADAGLSKLEEAAKAHEKDFVVDLGADRIIKLIGVHVFLALAIVTKITETVESNIICLPLNSTVSRDRQLISYASSYCWETPKQNASNCGSYTSTASMQMPLLLRELIQWFPYILLWQAFVYALPWAYWHIRFGAHVFGRLKFMQLLLENVYVKAHNKTFDFNYPEKPYDYSNARRPSRTMLEDEQQPSASFVANESATAEENVPLQVLTDSGATESINHQCEDEEFFKRLIVGKMRDRHFYSMLFYENFASMPAHLQFIISVSKLQASPKPKKESESGKCYLDEGMLKLWTHKNNLQSTDLINQYLRKHLFTALMALVMIIVWIYLAIVVSDDVITPEEFACQLAYENLCVLCSIRRKRDIFAIFVCDLALTILIFLGSLLNWWVVRQSVDKDTCHYFEQVKEIPSFVFEKNLPSKPETSLG